MTLFVASRSSGQAVPGREIGRSRGAMGTRLRKGPALEQTLGTDETTLLWERLF